MRSHSGLLTLFLILLWVLTMISIPIAEWTWGQTILLEGISLGVIMQATAVLAVLYHAWGAKQTLWTFLLVGVLSYTAELLGSKTGFPFGSYHYTSLLRPQLAGVPLLIPLAWMMMLPPSWAIARMILGQNHTRPLFALTSALAITAWDLFLDPQMVGWGFWAWEIPGQYFGIPAVNYFGWLLVSFAITLIISPSKLPLIPLAAIYTITWLLQTIGQGFLWNQPGPAMTGFVVCGIFVFLAWRNFQTYATA